MHPGHGKQKLLTTEISLTELPNFTVNKKDLLLNRKYVQDLARQRFPSFSARCKGNWTLLSPSRERRESLHSQGRAARRVVRKYTDQNERSHTKSIEKFKRGF